MCETFSIWTVGNVERRVHDFLIPMTSRRFVLSCHEANGNFIAAFIGPRPIATRDDDPAMVRRARQGVSLTRSLPWFPDSVGFSVALKKSHISLIFSRSSFIR